MVKHIFSGNIYTCFCVLVFYINVLADILTDHVLAIQLPIRIVLPVHRSLAIRFRSCSWSHCSLVFVTSLLSVWTSLTLLNFLLKDTFVCICIQSPSLVRNRDYFSSVRTVNRLCYIYLTSYAFLLFSTFIALKHMNIRLAFRCVRLKLCVAGSEWISCSGNSPFLLSFEWGSWMNLSSPGLLNFQSSVTSKSGLPRTQLWFWLLQCTRDDHKCLPLPVGGPVTLGPAWEADVPGLAGAAVRKSDDPQTSWLEGTWTDSLLGDSQLCPTFHPFPPAQYYQVTSVSTGGAYESPSWALPKFPTHNHAV